MGRPRKIPSNKDVQIRIPHKFVERDYQKAVFRAMTADGYKRGIQLWHRRSGKDKTDLNIMMIHMMHKVGSYFYFFPTYKQGKQVLWDGIDKGGMRFMDHIPKELRKRTDNTEMVIELVNGSIFRIVGTDDIDKVVGTNPIGCVFSEYSLQDPMVWGYIRPILAENQGWALFNGTPRGKNHYWELWEMAKKDPKWFTQKLTVEDTKCIPEEVLKQEKEEITAQFGDDALFNQEYYCQWDIPIQGAYYGAQLDQALEENRIRSIPYDANIPVSTYWDLGVGDATAIWFMQQVGNELRFIDYYETSGEGLQHYAKVLDQKQYVYKEHYAPHDIEVRELTTGKSRKDLARRLGLQFRVAPKLPLDDGIQAVRTLFNRCWFDEKRCKRGLDALRQYHKEWDEKNKTYKTYPKRDWSTHGSDAFRYFATSYRERMKNEELESQIRKHTIKGSASKPINRLTGW